jgi:zinc protease
MFMIQVTAKPGYSLTEIEKEIAGEIDRVKMNPPGRREVERSLNSVKAGLIYGLQSIGGKADRLNSYQFFTGKPDGFNEDLARFTSLTESSVQSAAKKYLTEGRVVFSVVPMGRTDLAAQ